MEEEKRFTEMEAERYFAIKYHGMAWDTWEKPDRNQDDNERMIDYAHAALTHWRVAGKEVNLQRGYWELSRVYALLKKGESALKYAQLCQQVFLAYPDQMEDFDFAFTYETLARSYASCGLKNEFQEHYLLAEEAGNKIIEKGERDFFFKELRGGEWFGFNKNEY